MQNKISAILFDYGGVIELSDFDLIGGIVEILSITREKWGAVYYTYNHLTNVEGKLWKEVALIVAKKIGATENQLSAISTLTEEADNKKKLNIELIEIIRKLKNMRLKTAVISNYTSILRQKIIEQGIHDAFDEIVISSEEGYQKPNPKLFEVAYKKLGVTASETIFIDNSPSSLTSAAGVGYTPILYTDNENLKRDLSMLLNTSL